MSRNASPYAQPICNNSSSSNPLQSSNLSESDIVASCISYNRYANYKEDGFTAKLEELKSQLSQLSMESSLYKKKCESMSQENSVIKSENDSLMQKLSKVKEENENLKEENMRLKSENKLSEDCIHNYSSNIDLSNKDKETNDGEICKHDETVYNKEIPKYQSEICELETKKEYIKGEIDEKENHIKELNAEIESKVKELEGLNKKFKEQGYDSCLDDDMTQSLEISNELNRTLDEEIGRYKTFLKKLCHITKIDAPENPEQLFLALADRIVQNSLQYEKLIENQQQLFEGLSLFEAKIDNDLKEPAEECPEISEFIMQKDELKSSIREFGKELICCQKQLEEMRIEISAAKELVNDREEKHRALSTNLGDLDSSLHANGTKFYELERRLHSMENKSSELDKVSNELLLEQKSVSGNILNEGESNYYGSSLVTGSDKLKEYDANHGEKLINQVQELSEEISKLREGNERLLADNNNLKEEHERLMNQVQTQDGEFNKLKDENERLLADNNNLKEEHERLMNQVQTQDGEFNKLKDENERLLADNNNLKEEHERLMNQFQTQDEEFNKLKDENERLQLRIKYNEQKNNKIYTQNDEFNKDKTEISRLNDDFDKDETGILRLNNKLKSQSQNNQCGNYVSDMDIDSINYTDKPYRSLNHQFEEITRHVHDERDALKAQATTLMVQDKDEVIFDLVKQIDEKDQELSILHKSTVYLDQSGSSESVPQFLEDKLREKIEQTEQMKQIYGIDSNSPISPRNAPNTSELRSMNITNEVSQCENKLSDMIPSECHIQDLVDKCRRLESENKELNKLLSRTSKGTKSSNIYDDSYWKEKYNDLLKKLDAYRVQPNLACGEQLPRDYKSKSSRRRIRPIGL